MKKIQKLAIIILCFSMLLSLCACGGGTNEETLRNEPVSNRVTSTEYTLSEYLAMGETIWYQMGEYEGKNSEVDRIFVLEPDGSMYIADRVKHTLGELEQMEDADIVEMVKAVYVEEVAAYGTGTVILNNEYNVTTQVRQSLFTPEAVFEIAMSGVGQESVRGILSMMDGTAMWTYMSDAVETEWASVELAYNAFAHLMDNPIIQLLGSDIVTDIVWWLLSFGDEGIEAGAGAEQVMMECGFYDMEEFGDVEALENDIAEAARLMETAIENVTNAVLADYETNQSTMEPAQYRLVLQSDETGNHTNAMILAYAVDTPVGQRCNTIYLDYENPVQKEDGKLTNCNHEVYDSLYGGYRYGQKGGKFYTRGEEDLHFVLDQVGESDLPVDVKDIESLFG